MNEEQLKALRKALSLGDGVSVEKVIETAQSAYQLSTSNATALTTANTAKADLEIKLNTANASVTSLTTERDGLKTTNTQLSTLNSQLADGVLNVLEGGGKITAAQRDETKVKLVGAEAKPLEVIKTINEKKVVLNLKEVELNGKRTDISTANARQLEVQKLVSKYQKEHECDYNAAHAAVSGDPANAQLFAAMQDPTQKKAA